MDVVVVFERLKKFTYLSAMFVADFREIFGHVSKLAGDNGPAVLDQPLGGGMQIGPLGDKPGAGPIGWNVVVFLVGKRFDILGAGFNRGGFNVDIGAGGVMGFDQADMIKKEFIAAGGSKLTRIFKYHPDFRGGAVVVIGKDFQDQRHFVRGVTFINHVFKHEFVSPDARPFFNRPFDHVAGDRRTACLVDRSAKARVSFDVGAAEFGGHHHLFDEFSDSLTFAKVSDITFCLQPLTTHRRGYVTARRAMLKPL
ncbi:MAG: hypothetical protein JWL59_2121 [Chthoniobacteraceae bacterium]|nr:hypothetical protein [Chthoniobacteraceae bacterium]